MWGFDDEEEYEDYINRVFPFFTRPPSYSSWTNSSWTNDTGPLIILTDRKANKQWLVLKGEEKDEKVLYKE